MGFTVKDKEERTCANSDILLFNPKILIFDTDLIIDF